MNATLPPPAPHAGDAPAVESPRPIPTNKLAAFCAAFYRDFWPHLPLALALVVIAGLIAALLAWDANHRVFRWLDLYETNILFQTEVRGLVTFCCPLIGVIIGVWQARSDRSANLWGFIKHRPAGAALMFGARVLAGLALYTIAVGIPVAVLLLVASRGVPFEWHFLLPTIADALTGLVYYLAALLAVQWQGPWFGSFVLPIIGALSCSVAVCGVPRFAEALGIIALAAAVYAAAALGAQSSRGFSLRAPAITRMAHALVVFTGLATFFVLASWGGEALVAGNLRADWSAVTTSSPMNSPEYRRLMTPRRIINYVLLPDATLGKRIYTPPPGEVQSLPDYDSSQYTTYERADPPGTPYPSTSFGPRRWPRNLYISYMPDVPNAATGYRELQAREAFHNANAAENWWYVEPVGLMQAYDQTGRYRGSLGENGFASPGTHAVPFGVKGYQVMLAETETIYTARGIFDLELAHRTIVPRWLYPKGVRLVAEFEFRDWLVAVAPDRLYVLGKGDRAHPAWEVPLAFPTATHIVQVAYFEEVRRWAVWYMPLQNRGHNIRVDIFDETWRQTAHFDVAAALQFEHDAPYPPVTIPVTISEPEVRLIHKLQILTGIVHAACGLPYVRIVNPRIDRDSLGLGIIPWAFEDYYTIVTNGFWADAAYFSGPWYYVPAGAVLLASGLAMFFLARRYNARFQVLWIAATLAFGPMMLILFACLHTLPRRVVCPTCHKPRFPAAPCCGHCGAAFPGPAPQGIDIFTASHGGAA